MDIQCPSCQKKLVIGDQFAGQLTKCPSCEGVFMAPTLATPPTTATVAATAPAPQPPTPDVIPFSGDAPPRPSYAPPVSSAPPPPPPSAPVTFEPEPSGPPGEFSKSHTLRLCPETLRWIVPGALTFLFLLSFFTWVSVLARLVGPDYTDNYSVWGLAFGEPMSVSWIFYILITFFLALPLASVRLLMEINVIPTPAAIGPFWKWRPVLLGGLLTFTLLLALLGRMMLMPLQTSEFGMFLGLRVHLVAVIVCALEYWLIHRKTTRLPLPEVTARW